MLYGSDGGDGVRLIGFVSRTDADNAYRCYRYIPIAEDITSICS
jgi:hypothetical protein